MATKKSTKPIDITRTGAQSYRDLQEENARLFQQAQQTAAIENMPVSYSNQPTLSEIAYEGPEQSPIMQQSDNGDYWGNSMFDSPTATEDEWSYEGLNDVRANNQPLIAKWGSALGNAVVLAGTTFLDGTLGLVYGAGSMINTWAQGDGFLKGLSKLYDNEVSNGLQAFNRYAQNELMPYYKTQESQETPWYEQLGSVDFWADGFLKNMGFTIGTLYSGGLFTKALKGLGFLSKANSLGAMLAGSAYSAVNEGRIEANQNNYDTATRITNLLNQSRADAINEIRANSALTQEEKYARLDEIDKNYQNELSNLDNQLIKSGLTDLAINVPVLMFDNFLLFGKFYSKGFGTSKGVGRITGRLKADNPLRKTNEAFAKSQNPIARNISRIEEGAEDAGRYVWNTVSSKKTVGKGLLTALREGNEELAQAMAAEYAANQFTDSPDSYYRAITDPTARREAMSTQEALVKAFLNTYGNGDRWEEFTIGALTGLLGTPTFGRVQNADANTYLGRGKMVGLTGGIFGELASARETNKRGGLL